MASSIGMARDNQRTPLARRSKTRKPFVDLITGRGRRFSGRDVKKHEKQKVRRGRKQADKKTGEGGFGWKGGIGKGPRTSLYLRVGALLYKDGNSQQTRRTGGHGQEL